MWHARKLVMADAAAELDEGGVVRTLKDLFAGAAGGIAQVLLGKFGVPFCFSFVIESQFRSESRGDRSGRTLHSCNVRPVRHLI